MPTSTSLKISTLSYVVIYVSDIAKSMAFYRDKLGMTVKMNQPSWVEFETGATTLGLHATDNMPEVKDGHPALIFQVDDVYAAAAALKANGIKLKEEPRQVCEEGDKVGISADFVDLDGNLLAVFSLLPKQ